jgi:hypothetical protein
MFYSDVGNFAAERKKRRAGTRGARALRTNQGI